jgi:hypothetical protein
MNNIKMKTVIIEKNNNYFKRVSIIMLMVFILYILFNFLYNPSEHTYFLLPTKNAVIIFSIVGSLSCCLVIFLVIKSVFQKDVFLKIDGQGVFYSFFLHKNTLIKWDEISKIETIKYNYNNYIAIFLKETPNYEKGISSLFFKMNEKSFGTPYIITSGNLDCTFDELERLILEGYNQSKQIKKGR